MARNAIYHSLKILQIRKESTVIVPSYICRSAVEPVIAYGCHVRLYNIHRDCSADLSDIQRWLSKGAKVVIAVHYFGFPQRINEIRKLCDLYGAILIEDCAHVLSGTYQERHLGDFGDASVFSWKKQLPVYDGATLYIKNKYALNKHKNIIYRNHESYISTIKILYNMVYQSKNRGIKKPNKTMGNIIQSMVAFIKIRILSENMKNELVNVEDKGTEFTTQMVDMPMTKISQWIYNHMDFDKIVEIRRRNYSYIVEALVDKQQFGFIHPILCEGICPWVLPIIVHGVNNAHFQLRALGVPAATWDGVKPENINLDEYPDAEYLYKKLIFLPIHQSLNNHNLNFIIDKIMKLGFSGS